MSNAGNLRQYPLTEVLRIIANGQRNGRLVIERGGLRADLYVERGYLSHAWRSGPATPLLTRWLSARFFTPDQAAQLASLLQLDPRQLDDATLAKMAVDSGVVSLQQLTQWAMNDAVDLLMALLAWPDGDYRFEENMMPHPTRLRLPIPLIAIVSEAVQRFNLTSWQQAAQQERTVDVTLNDVLEFADIDKDDAHPVTITREQWAVLTLVDGESTVEQIAGSLVNYSDSSPQYGPQRYTIEFQRSCALALRVCNDLVASGIMVLPNQENSQLGPL